MANNGFSAHRMLRLRTVHEVACALAGLPPADPAQQLPPPGWQSPAVSALAAAGGVFVVTAVPGAASGVRSRLDIQQADVGQDAGTAR